MEPSIAQPSLSDFENRIRYHFSNASLLELAFTHTSCESPLGNNQRLEFLGDAVLDMIIAEALYHKHPDQNEGSLDHMRAHLVNGKALATHARELSIDRFLRVSRTQRERLLKLSTGILEDALEALIGAIYLDGGIDAARSFVLKVFEDAIHSVLENKQLSNPKGRLQEWLQSRHAGAVPTYLIRSTEGPEHARLYTAAVEFNGSELGRGQGNSKKAAEAAAAEVALTNLKFEV